MSTSTMYPSALNGITLMNNWVGSFPSMPGLRLARHFNLARQEGDITGRREILPGAQVSVISPVIATQHLKSR